jgi:hypothetical protein
VTFSLIKCRDSDENEANSYDGAYPSKQERN